MFGCALVSHSSLQAPQEHLTLIRKPVAAERKPLWLQFHPGDFVGCGKDHTLYALKDGIVIFKKTKYLKKVRAGKGYVLARLAHN